MTNTDTINDFLRIFSAWQAGFTNLQRTYFIIKTNGQEHLRYCEELYYSDICNISKFNNDDVSVDTESLSVQRKNLSLNFDTAKTLIEQSTTNVFEPHHRNNEISQYVPTGQLDYYLDPLRLAPASSVLRWPTLHISGRPEQTINLPNESKLSLELMMAPTPYGSINELADSLGIPEFAWRDSTNARTQIVLSPPAEFSSTAITHEKLTVGIRCHPSLRQQLFYLGVRAFPNQMSPTRFSISGTKFSWLGDSTMMEGSTEITLQGCPSADLHLGYSEELIGTQFVFDENYTGDWRLTLHQSIDNKLDFINNFFDERDNCFEDQISLLLHLVGFKVMHFGNIKSLRDAPDILAYSDNGLLFIIECTTAEISDHAKLVRLNRRARDIKNIIHKNISTLEDINTVLFCKINREDTNNIWNQASDLNVSLICREEISEILKRLQQNIAPEIFHQIVKNSVPTTKSTGLELD